MSHLILVSLAFGVSAAPAPDLAHVDRHLGKQPRYVCDRPLYGLFVLGPTARTRVWVVLDKSSRNQPDYDVAWVDRNANGDLTDQGERFAVKRPDSDTGLLGLLTRTLSGSSASSGQDRRAGQHEMVDLDIGPVGDPGVAERPQMRLFLMNNAPVGAFLVWKNGRLASCGFDESGHEGTMQFSPDPATAPVFWPGFEEPLAIQRRFWPGMDRALRIDRLSPLHIFLGHRGQGRNTFCAVSESCLPRDVKVQATLIYTDQAGKERRARAELADRC